MFNAGLNWQAPSLKTPNKTNFQPQTFFRSRIEFIHSCFNLIVSDICQRYNTVFGIFYLEAHWCFHFSHTHK